MPSNFAPIERELPDVYEVGRLAERAFQRDPRGAAGHLRVFGERFALALLELHRLPTYQERQIERLRRIRSDTPIEGSPLDHLHTLRRIGNKSLHGRDAVGHADAMTMLKAAHRLTNWYWRHQTRQEPPKPRDFVRPRSMVAKPDPALERQLKAAEARARAAESDIERLKGILDMPEVATHTGVAVAFDALPEAAQKQAAAFLKRFRDEPFHDDWPLVRPAQEVVDDKARLIVRDGLVVVVIAPPHDDLLIIATLATTVDDALGWVRSKRFEVNPVLGVLQVFDVEGASAAAEDFLGGLFDAHDDDTLEGLGVPEKLLDAVRNVATEDDLDELTPHVPPDVADVLFLLASGETVADIRRQLDIERVREVDTDDFAVAVHHPESRRAFALLEDDDDLEAVLAGSLAAWRVYLHPDQRKLVTMKANGPVRVLGGAGTGKTVALLHRARYLVQSVFGEPDERLLVTSFTRNLPQDLRAQMAQLVDREDLRRMDFVHLHGYASELWKVHGDGRPVAYDLDTEWAAAMTDDDLQLGEAFYRAEWEQVVQDQGITDEVDYMRCRRPGRGSPLPRSRRKAVWRVFTTYRSALDARGVIEAADLFRLLTERLASGAIPREYVSLLCDEVQDFGSPELRFMRALIAPDANDLFFVGDTHQRIYGHEVTMGRCGIAIQGRARRLRVNYRTTARVRQFAVGALTGLSFDDMDGGTQDLKGYRSIRVGLEPHIELLKSKAAEHKAIVQRVTAWLEHVEPEAICVAAPTKSALAGAKKALTGAGHRVHVIQSSVSDEGSGIRMATFARMKGLEFQRVLLAGVNEGQVPLRPSSWYTMDADGKALFDRQQRCLLYVAATRARDVLAVTGHGRPSPFLTEDDAKDQDLPDEPTTKTCPRCGESGTVAEMFGYRRCRRTRADGTEVVVEAPQSYCRACR
jgi:hypothetical protein